MKKKRVLPFILCLIIAMSLLSMMAFAEGYRCGWNRTGLSGSGRGDGGAGRAGGIPGRQLSARSHADAGTGREDQV